MTSVDTSLYLLTRRVLTSSWNTPRSAWNCDVLYLLQASWMADSPVDNTILIYALHWYRRHTISKSFHTFFSREPAWSFFFTSFLFLSLLPILCIKVKVSNSYLLFWGQSWIFHGLWTGLWHCRDLWAWLCTGSLYSVLSQHHPCSNTVRQYRKCFI